MPRGLPQRHHGHPITPLELFAGAQFLHQRMPFEIFPHPFHQRAGAEAVNYRDLADSGEGSVVEEGLDSPNCVIHAQSNQV